MESILCQINYICPSPVPGCPPRSTCPGTGVYCNMSIKRQRGREIYDRSIAIYEKPSRHNRAGSGRWGKGIAALSSVTILPHLPQTLAWDTFQPSRPEFHNGCHKLNFLADECCWKKVEVKLFVGQIYFLLANPTPPRPETSSVSPAVGLSARLVWQVSDSCSLNIQRLSHYQTRGASVNQSGPTLMHPTLPGWIRRRPLVALLVQRGGRGRVLIFSLYPDCAVT